MSHKYDFLFKLLIIGESGVGKTCLLLRFTDDSFTANHLTTIGIDFKIKIIHIDNKLIKLQIWDTAGQERFRTITKTYYKGAHGIILTYDVTDQNSFKNIRNWIKQIEANAQTNVKKVLVGNKCDKPDRVVTEEEGKKLADDFGMNFFETSAKTNQNVNEVFNFLTQEILKSNEKNGSSGGEKLKKNHTKDKKNGQPAESVYSEPVAVPFINAAIWLIRTEVLKKVGLFAPIFYHYGEDKDMANRMAYYHYKIGYVPTVFACHDREFRQPTRERFFHTEKVYHLSEYTNPNHNFGTACAHCILAVGKKVLSAFLKGKWKDAGAYIKIGNTLLLQTKAVIHARSISKHVDLKNYKV